MNVDEFVAKWAANRGREMAAYVEHFNDLCELLGEKKPNEADPNGDFFAFQKGAPREGAQGWADVWQRSHFAWEYKGKGKDLRPAYRQVREYSEALENPPLLVVCNFDRYEIHTNWNNTESWIYRFGNEDIAASAQMVEVVTGAGSEPRDAPQTSALQVLRAAFTNPDVLKPRRTRDEITEEAAARFFTIGDELRKYGIADERVAKFVTRLVFCMFASDVGLLDRETFSDVVRLNKGDPKKFRRHLSQLFRTMRTGGEFQMREVPFFNGKLFDDADVPEALDGQHIRILEELDNMNWADVEPAIFGTLFERVIDPGKRRALGAHYTSRDDIELIVKPTLMWPLEREWRLVQSQILEAVSPRSGRRVPEARQREKVRQLAGGFLSKLGALRVLDPACGSGNFLYVSLALLKELEKQVIALARLYKVPLKPRVRPQQLQASRSTRTRTNWRVSSSGSATCSGSGGTRCR